MRNSILILALLSVGPALAQPVQAPSDPEKQALAYEVQECQAGKLRSTTEAFQLQVQLAAATKRADEAEARLRGSQDSSPTAKER